MLVICYPDTAPKDFGWSQDLAKMVLKPSALEIYQTTDPGGEKGSDFA